MSSQHNDNSVAANDNSFGTSFALGLIKSCVCVYDVITYPIYVLIQKPWLTRQHSSSVKAKQLDPKSPYNAWTRIRKPDTHFIESCETVPQLFSKAIEVYNNKQCFGFRPLLGEEEEQQNGKKFRKLILGDYQWFSYNEIDERISSIGKGLLKTGLKPKETVLIFAETRLEWMLCAQSIFRVGGTVATLYATLGDEGIIHGINETEVRYIITSYDLLPKLEKLQSDLPLVTTIIYMEGLQKSRPNLFNNSKIELISLSSVEQTGRRYINDNTVVGETPKGSDIAVLMYTSGSTGIPKGVMITHRNLLKATEAFFTIAHALNKSDVYIAYLPLAHVLELAAELFFVSVGMSVGYANTLTLTDKSTGLKKGCLGDATLLKPTIMTAVPLVLDRIRKGITEQVEAKGKFFKAFFNFAIDYKKFWTKRGFKTPILNFLICRKIKAMIGGRVRVLACGAAPLSPETQEFIRACLDLDLLQGYGLTETSASAALMDLNDLSVGRVGAPLTGVKIKLIDWIEGGYRVTDKPNPRGEVVVGGENITAGYYKNDALTRECYKVEDGIRWFYTGDIGEIFPDGTLKIIDRKKDLVKLQYGEYISLGKVEAELKSCPYVDNICVYGDAFRDYLIALVVPSQKAIYTLAQQFSKPENLIQLCKDQQIINAITRAIHEHALKSKLHKTEIPTKIKLCAEEWLPDSGLVTAALKLRRKNIQERYQMDINRLYGIEQQSKST